MILRSVAELPIKKGDRVLVRVDYNIPVNPEGLITDDARIKGTLDTLEYLLERGAVPIILSHWGRPQGGPQPEMSLARILPELQTLLNHPVNFLSESLNDVTKASIDAAHAGEIFLLENLRFHPGERKNDPQFAKKLASYGSYYVNDAFPVSHREHASISLLPTLFNDPAAGFSLLREVDYFSKVLHAPEKPFIVIIGGKKIQDKVRSLRFLLDKVDEVLVGGGSSYTVQVARGLSVGQSIVDEDLVDEIDDIADSPKVKLPIDYVAAPTYAEPEKKKVVRADAFPDDLEGFDIGPQTRKEFAEFVSNAKTILWFGPLGAFEEPAFAEGSLEVAKAVVAANERGAITVTGGGDLLAMLRAFDFKDKLSHVSIGGGACLAFLEGNKLPGIVPLIKER